VLVTGVEAAVLALQSVTVFTLVIAAAGAVVLAAPKVRAVLRRERPASEDVEPVPAGRVLDLAALEGGGDR
jgi:hypothetical protein